MPRDAIAALALNLVAQPLRVALTGWTVSPCIFEMLTMLGPDESNARLQVAAG